MGIIHAYETNDTPGKAERYEPAQRDISDWSICCKASYHIGQADLTVERSERLSQEIIDTRTAYETTAPPVNSQQEYFERFWPIQCDTCGRKELMTQATAELLAWCLKGKTQLCPDCDKTVKQEMQEAFDERTEAIA